MIKIVSFLLCVMALTAPIKVSANDPMRPPGVEVVTNKKSPVKQTSFKLQQIKISEESRSAVINGQLVREGDTVSGAKVMKITSDKVVLKYRKKLRFLSLINKTKHSEK